MGQPKLIESGTMYFYKEWLSRYHEKKVLSYSKIVNLGVFLVFLGVFGGWLAWRYMSRPTPEELTQKQLEQQKYLADKVAILQKSKEGVERKERLERAGGYLEPDLAHSSSNLITDFPQYENEFHMVHGLKTI